MIKIIRYPGYKEYFGFRNHEFPSTTYLQIGRTRFVWHDGVYSGHYKFK